MNLAWSWRSPVCIADALLMFERANEYWSTYMRSDWHLMQFSSIHENGNNNQHFMQIYDSETRWWSRAPALSNVWLRARWLRKRWNCINHLVALVGSISWSAGCGSSGPVEVGGIDGVAKAVLRKILSHADAQGVGGVIVVRRPTDFY